MPEPNSKNPMNMNDWVDIRHYLEKLIEERDRLYDTRFKAAETAVSAALAAQEKQTAFSFTASEKAVLKAENAQSDYNQRSNEFRGQLDDQAKTLMPRSEAVSMHKGIEEKLAGMVATEAKDIDILRNEIATLREFRSGAVGKDELIQNALREINNLRTEVQGLREFRSGSIIKDTTLQHERVQNDWSTSLLVTISIAIIGWLGTFTMGLLLYLKK